MSIDSNKVGIAVEFIFFACQYRCMDDGVAHGYGEGVVSFHDLLEFGFGS